MEELNILKEKGRGYLINKQHSEAVDSYLQCIEVIETKLLQGVSKRDIAIIYLNLGICYTALKNTKESIIYVDKAIETDPSYFKFIIQSYYRKARILLEMQDYRQAIMIINQLQTKEPCKEVFDLKKEIQDAILKSSNIYHFDQIKNDLQECGSEKDIQKVFAGLYNRPEDLEAYHEILDEDQGFCQQLLTYTLKSPTDKLSILSLQYAFKFVSYIWKFIKQQLGERRSFIPSWLTQILIINFDLFIRGIQFPKKQEFQSQFFDLFSYSNIIYSNTLEQFQNLLLKKENQYYFLDKNLVETTRLLFHNLTYCEKCQPEEIKAICDEKVLFVRTIQNIVHYLSKYLKNMHFSEENKQFENQFDTENELVHLILELMITLFKITDQVQLKLKQLKLDMKDVYFFDFFQRESLRKKDLLILISIIGANYQKFKEKSTLYKIHEQILSTLLKKKDSMESIDLIKYVLSLVLKEDDFSKKLTESYLTEKVNRELQGYIREYKQTENTAKQFIFNLKYLNLLFQVNNRSKFLQLYEYLLLINCENFIQQVFLAKNVLIHDSLSILTFIASFDDAKKIMIKSNDNLKTYITHIHSRILELQNTKIQYKKSSIHKIQVYACSISLIQFLLTLCTDQSKDYREEQKDKFGIDDEQYQMAKQLEKKYKPEGSVDTDLYFKYDEKFILKHEVLHFIGLDLEGIKIISEFLATYEDELTDYGKQMIAQVLSRLSQDESLVPHLFDKRSLRLVAKLCLKGYRQQTDGQIFLSKVMCQANPSLFEYKDLHILVDALMQSAQGSKHELQIFQSLLGVVQLTSLGDDVCQRLVSPTQIVCLQNFLMEENHYIIHAALQILNNVALSTRFQQFIEEQPLTNFCKILKAISEMEYDRLLKYFLGNKLNQQYDDEQLVAANNFSHPLKIMQTLLSIYAILSFSEKFTKEHEEYFAILKDQEFYSHLLAILKDQHIQVQFELIHKIICIWENLNLKELLIKQVIMLKNLFEPNRDQLQKENKDQLSMEKLDKIVKFYTLQQ